MFDIHSDLVLGLVLNRLDASLWNEVNLKLRWLLLPAVDLAVEFCEHCPGLTLDLKLSLVSLEQRQYPCLFSERLELHRECVCVLLRAPFQRPNVFPDPRPQIRQSLATLVEAICPFL